MSAAISSPVGVRSLAGETACGRLASSTLSQTTAQFTIKSLGGRWYGSYGVARCPAHDDTTPSLSVTQRNGRVLVHCHAGCSQQDVICALKNLGMWESASASAGTPSDRRTPEPVPVAGNRRGDAHALAIWRTTLPAAGTPVATYLRTRGIGIIPPALRYAPDLQHSPSRRRFPAMVAAVQAVDGRITGIHRTFLSPNGLGKAPIDRPKMMLGPCACGAVRLASTAPTLAIGEGIETCLSAMIVTGMPAWAALSTSGLKALQLPAEVRGVVILADADAPGEAAAEVAARRWIREGRRVRIARPPAGRDFNDVLLERGAPVTEAPHG